ncbi:MAG: cell division protein ZapA [Prevotellaceae bacterium]|jgi:cell division protein ZapA (FtsZ GTPase activity inhibitor)|nr:cell division protein ZapA [Prevotellaceae bacterium]
MNGERVMVSANITIASRVYMMSVPSEVEEYIRKAERLIEEKLYSLDKEYNDRDIQDKLSVILLNVTTRFLEYQAHSDIRNAEINEIDRKLGFYLEKQQGSLDNIE